MAFALKPFTPNPQPQEKQENQRYLPQRHNLVLECLEALGHGVCICKRHVSRAESRVMCNG